jgi:SAM-dependent methyltransferase
MRRNFAVWIFSAAALFAQNGEHRRPDVPYVPTSPQAVQAMLRLAGVQKSDVVYDLGCGDGRIVVAAAKDFGAHAVGIDIDPQRIQEARDNAHKAGVENLVKIVEGDLFTADIHDATVVTLFLLTSVNAKLRPKLLQDLKPGTRVVSNTFDMGDWKPEKELAVENASDSDYFSRKLYLWIVPAKH